MKKDDRQSVHKGRRAFLRDTAAAGAGVAIATALPGTASADGSDTPDAGAASAKQQQGYHLTQHILDYYKTLT